VGECLFKARPACFCATDLIGIDLLTACFVEFITLEIKVLLIR